MGALIACVVNVKVEELFRARIKSVALVPVLQLRVVQRVQADALVVGDGLGQNNAEELRAKIGTPVSRVNSQERQVTIWRIRHLLVLLKLLNLKVASVRNKGKAQQVAAASENSKAVLTRTVAPAVAQAGHGDILFEKSLAEDILD